MNEMHPTSEALPKINTSTYKFYTGHDDALTVVIQEDGALAY